MKNFFAVVFLMGLVIVQGSSLFEQVLENDNGLDNEGNNARAVSTDIVKLTGDTSDLKRKDNIDAIGTSPIRDKFKRNFLPTKLSHHMHNLIYGEKNIPVTSDFKFKHPVDVAGKIDDLFVGIFKTTVNKVKEFIPDRVSIEKDLAGNVECSDYTCDIHALGLSITVSYDPDNIGLSLLVTFLGFTVVEEKISTTGFRYCEPIELPIKKLNFCIEVSKVKFTKEMGCMNLEFEVLGYSHIFPDLCVYGSRMTD